LKQKRWLQLNKGFLDMFGFTAVWLFFFFSRFLERVFVSFFLGGLEAKQTKQTHRKILFFLNIYHLTSVFFLKTLNSKSSFFVHVGF